MTSPAAATPSRESYWLTASQTLFTALDRQLQEGAHMYSSASGAQPAARTLLPGIGHARELAQSAAQTLSICKAAAFAFALLAGVFALSVSGLFMTGTVVVLCISSAVAGMECWQLEDGLCQLQDLVRDMTNSLRSVNQQTDYSGVMDGKEGYKARLRNEVQVPLTNMLLLDKLLEWALSSADRAPYPCFILGPDPTSIPNPPALRASPSSSSAPPTS